MSATAKKVRLKLQEESLIVAYANLKLKQNRLAKEIDTMRQNVVNLFDNKKVNVLFAKDKQGDIFGIQRINRKRKKFDTANFKIKHTDLFNKFTTEIEYSEYKALGDSNE
jgi:DNA-binding XRE family transcriptional regulator|tara:strand:- start:1028 stop:1357 length:330 start_codon:yes stop_codon:yes gene_type:complete